MKRSRKEEGVKDYVSESEESEDDLEVDSDEEDSTPEFIDYSSEGEESEIEFEDEEEEDLSEAEFDEDTNLPILTSKLSDKLVENAKKCDVKSVKELVSVFYSVISSLNSGNSHILLDKKDKRDKVKFKHLKNENKRILKNTAKRFLDSKVLKKTFVIRDRDVYNSFVSRTYDVMSEFIKGKDVTGKREDVMAVAHLVKKFFSTSILHLAFNFDDFDLVRSSLISLSSSHVMRWICVFRGLNSQFVKIVSSLMCGHPQKLTRINCFQFLSEFLNCVKNHKLMSVKLSPKSQSVNYIKLNETNVKLSVNELLTLLLKSCYSSHVKSVMNGITLKNYGLFKLTQNCISQLYVKVPHDNLYVFAFKNIGDMALNVRREWNESSNAKKNKGKSDKNMYLTVASWGFIESVNIWINVLINSGYRMRVLVYPLVTVINSAIKIKICDKKNIPFVLNLLLSLNQLSDGINKFIPIVSFLFNVLESIKNIKPTAEKKKNLEKDEDIMIKLKLKNKTLNSKQISGVLNKYVELILVDHLGITSLSPSFPEYTNFILYYLKRYIKSRQVDFNFKNSMMSLFKVINDTNKQVVEMRDKMTSELSEKNSANLKLFEPNKIIMYKYRQDYLLKHQQASKDKFISSLQMNQI